MATILRLRGLGSEANAEDIRSFFGGFQIPAGGVFIVGGAFGEAFIALSSDEEGLQALKLHGHSLKDCKIDLHMSSMLEAEHKLDSFLKRKKTPKSLAKKQSSGKKASLNVKPVNVGNGSPEQDDSLQLPVEAVEQTLRMNSHDKNAALILGVCTLLKGLSPSQTNVGTKETPIEPSSPEQPIEVHPGFVRVFGLPLTTTQQDICSFFKGLDVQDVLMNVELGVCHGSLVKFGSLHDAKNALGFNNCLLGSVSVEVRNATEQMWLSALQDNEGASHQVELKQTPLKDTLNYKHNLSWLRKRQCSEDFLHKASKKFKNRQSTDTPSDKRHIIMVSNLPEIITKTEIKELFGCPNIAHTNVLHLLDSCKNRTDKAFVIFDKREDYDYAINLSGCHIGTHKIDVTQITEEEMKKTMQMARDKPFKLNSKMKKIGKNKSDTDEQSPDLCSTARTCVYVRNMPANVRKSQIRSLFTENKLKEDNIRLLYDTNGTCIGEAVVQFQSQTNAALALMHHGMEFLGSKLLLTPISVQQMENILANDRH